MNPMKNSILISIGLSLVIAASAGAPALGLQSDSQVNAASPNRTVGRAQVFYFKNPSRADVDLFNLTIMGGDDERIDLNLNYSVPGSRVHLPETVNFDVQSIARATRFKGIASVAFVVDGERLQPISANYQIAKAGGSVYQDLMFKLDIKIYQRIARARSAVIKLGKIEVSLTDKHREALCDMLRAAED
jgi:hypothetical protein